EKAFEEYEEDIELIDLKEELGEDVYTTLINNRYDTALEVLTAGPEKLLEIEGFDEEKVNSIIELIKSQFEEEE
ncbi:MAG: transcription termination/antitermination protein NusA, partial [Ignavibacteriaceae bacterium]